MNEYKLETKNSLGQVQDDPDLLRLMLEDIKKAPDIYKPTNYWSFYEKTLLTELFSMGLNNFRRRRNSILDSFGASDLFPNAEINLLRNKLFYNRVTCKVPFWKNALNSLNGFLNKIFPVSYPYEMTLEDLRHLIYDNVNLEARRIGAKTLDQLDISLIGNPEDCIEVDGKVYTWLMLSYYMQYLYCCQFINFNDIQVIVELGSGAGKQTEIIKKLHPHITFLLFDIPPQAYVCEQYLKAVFPKEVVSYRQTRTLEKITITSDIQGKICIFGNWKFPCLKNFQFDLFWNTASFQEMESEVVTNYLKYVNQGAKTVFLRQVMEGKNQATKKGNLGVLNPVLLEHYKQGLSNFKLVDLSPIFHPIWKVSRKNYKDSFWKR